MLEAKPEADRECVWDYPRPPRLEPCLRIIRVEFNDKILAETSRALRVLETSHPPTYYIPKADIKIELLAANPKRSFCEYKGMASYWDIHDGAAASIAAAWSYPSPSEPYSALRDHFAFYSQRVQACFVDGERVQSQEGEFYGGWITSHVIGPFKGGAGTTGW
jgi:uncharacterized protein (DUF427 family)